MISSMSASFARMNRRWCFDQPLVDRYIIGGHSRNTESPLEYRTAGAPAQVRDPLHCPHRVFNSVANESRNAVVYDLRHRATATGNHRRSARHGLNHHQSKRLGPIDRKQQRGCVAQELALVRVTDLAQELDAWRP